MMRSSEPDTPSMSAAPSMRRARRLTRTWAPRDYQTPGVQFLVEREHAALFSKAGSGKTTMTLEAFRILKERGEAHRMLVVAPSRPADMVWMVEHSQWTNFEHFKVARITDKNDPFKEDADIYVINYERAHYLADYAQGKKPWPVDTMVFDELRKVKSHTSKRAKGLRPLARRSLRCWGLTGTPMSNGYIDLFGQMLMVDGGKSLGTRVTLFRQQYFDHNPYTHQYTMRPGADTAIREAISDSAMFIDVISHDVLDNVLRVRMSKKERETYDKFRTEAVADVGDAQIVGSTAGVVWGKLKQLANGAIYTTEDTGPDREYECFHDAKIDCLVDLIESLDGQPVLVAYQYRHDLYRIRKALSDRLGLDVPYIGSGVSLQKAKEIEAAWNRNEVPVLLGHPASMGHGLNLQKGSACNICWFSITVDQELYEQFIARLRRQGNQAEAIINHLIVCENTVDEVDLVRVRGKEMTQAQFLQNLRHVLEARIPSQMEEEDMKIRKLGAPAPETSESVKEVDDGLPEQFAGGELDAPAGMDVGKALDAVSPPKEVEPDDPDPRGFSAAVMEALGKVSGDVDSPDTEDAPKPEPKAEPKPKSNSSKKTTKPSVPEGELLSDGASSEAVDTSSFEKPTIRLTVEARSADALVRALMDMAKSIRPAS